MNRFLKWQYILLLCLSCLWISPIYITSPRAIAPVLAQSDLSLKSDIISLRARISRLEQEVNRLRNSASPSPRPPKAKQPTPPPAQRPTVINPPVVDGRAIGRSDPFYERLATLLIELKEDVQKLDRRLNAIEQTSP